MTSSVWVNGNSPGSSPLNVEFADPQHVIVDSMPAGGSGLTDAELRAAPVEVTVENIPHVIVDSMPAGGSGLTDAELRASPVVVDLGANNDVTVAGVATAANQLPDGHNVTVDNAAGAAAVNIQDGGNVITVDGTVSVNTHAVTQSGTWILGANSGVDIGDVTLNNATIAVTQSGAWDEVGINDSGNSITVDDGGSSLTVDGTVAVSNFPGASSGLMYVYNIPSQVHVAAANTVHWDLFNADAALVVTVVGIYQLPNITTAVTGVAFDWLLERTTAVGTGGSVITAWLPDTTQTAMDADITCRSKPTGGATQSTDLRNYTIHSEETNAATQMMHMMMAGGVANLVPPDSGGIVLRQNQGIRCVQVTNSNAGNTGWCICIMVE